MEGGFGPLRSLGPVRRRRSASAFRLSALFGVGPRAPSARPSAQSPAGTFSAPSDPFRPRPSRLWARSTCLGVIYARIEQQTRREPENAPRPGPLCPSLRCRAPVGPFGALRPGCPPFGFGPPPLPARLTTELHPDPMGGDVTRTGSAAGRSADRRSAPVVSYTDLCSPTGGRSGLQVERLPANTGEVPLTRSAGWVKLISRPVEPVLSGRRLHGGADWSLSEVLQRLAPPPAFQQTCAPASSGP